MMAVNVNYDPNEPLPGWSAPLHQFWATGKHGRRYRPGSLNRFVPLLAQPITLDKMWVYGQGHDWVLYYNPQIHNHLSMELVC